MNTMPSEVIPALRIITIAAGLTALTNGVLVLLGNQSEVGTVAEAAGAISMLGAIGLATHHRTNDPAKRSQASEPPR